MNETSYLLIHPDSVFTFVGAIITAAFSIFYITYYVTIRRERFYRSLSTLLFTVSVYLTGYAIYASSTDPSAVLAWTRVCYAGVSAVVITSYLLSSDVTGSHNSVLGILFLSVSAILIAATLIPGDFLFTGVLNPEKLHSSVIKGRFFPHFLIALLVSLAVLLIRFITLVIRDRSRLKYYVPIIIGLAFWFVEGVFDAVFAAMLSIIQFKLSLGPIVMTFSMAIFAGKIAEAQRAELAEVKQKNEEIYRNLIYDGLSKLFTREYFNETLTQKIALHTRKSKIDTVVFLDVDNFKAINDELGHERGDSVIQLVGSVLTSHSRRNDVCARFGGDEFLMLLEDCSAEDARQIAVRIQQDMATELREQLGSWPGTKNISLSIGVLSSDNWPDDPKEILRLADQTMYESKQLGKSRVSVYTADG